MERSRTVNAMGVVSSITYPAYGGSTQLDVILSLHDCDRDVGESLLLRFLGRRTMSCLEIGSRVRVNGTLSQVTGTPVVFNPDITLISGE